ncbi:MAG: hypothetical protein AAGG51_11550 [Cyanobacteria bacterium P01_G01_bin.54]
METLRERNLFSNRALAAHTQPTLVGATLDRPSPEGIYDLKIFNSHQIHADL